MTGLGSLANIRHFFPRGGDYSDIAGALSVALAEIEDVINARYDGYIAGCSFGELGLSHADAWRAFIDEREAFAVKSCQQKYGDEMYIDYTDGHDSQRHRWKLAVDITVENYIRDMKLRRAFQIGWQEAAFARTLK